MAMAELTSAGRSHEIENKGVDTTIVHAKADHGDRSSASSTHNGDGAAEITGGGDSEERGVTGARNRKREWFAYVKTKQFWLVLVFGWVLLFPITHYDELFLLAPQLALLY